MDAKNIATCLAPTLLNMTKENTPTSSLLTPNSSSSPTSMSAAFFRDPTQMMSRQCNASVECLALMIDMPKKIFQIPSEAFSKSQLVKTDYFVPPTINELPSPFSLGTYLNERIDDMMKVNILVNFLEIDSDVKIRYML